MLRFQELVETRNVIRVRSKFPFAETIHGILLAASEAIRAVLQEAHEFHLNGYTAMLLANVLAIRSRQGGGERS